MTKNLFSPESFIDTHIFDKRIFVSLYPFNSFCAGAFPFVHRVLFIPCMEELSLLVAQSVVWIGRFHIQRSSGHFSLRPGRWFKTRTVHLGIAYSESGKSFTKVINESIQNINFIDVKYYNGNFIAVGENNLKAIFSIIKKESNYLNTGFKVLTSGKADETIKIYKN